MARGGKFPLLQEKKSFITERIICMQAMTKKTVCYMCGLCAFGVPLRRLQLPQLKKKSHLKSRIPIQFGGHHSLLSFNFLKYSSSQIMSSKSISSEEDEKYYKSRQDRKQTPTTSVLKLTAFLLLGSALLIQAIVALLRLQHTIKQENSSSVLPNVPPLLTKKPNYLPNSKIPLNFSAVREGKFRPNFKQLQWILAPGSASSDSGTYLLKDTINEDSVYVVKSVLEEDYHYVLFNKSEFSYDGQPYVVESLTASPDLTKAILKTNQKKGWRHSSFALYWILDVKTQSIEPVFNTNDLLSVTLWAPTSDKIAFVYENNVYIKFLFSGAVSQVTFDGNKNIFNGKPDWVYEEEVFASDKTLWFSPQGDKLGFLRFNDTLVPEFPIPYYVQDGHSEYPEVVTIKYPKPGYPNPEVDLIVYHVIDPSSASSTVAPADLVRLENTSLEKLITEVLWVSDDHILVKTSNRASDELQVFLVSVAKGKAAKSALVRSHHAQNSWFEVTSSAIYVPKNESAGRLEDGYLDLVEKDGFNHLAYFTPPENPRPKFLTQGKWEVLTNQFDSLKNKVYFQATQKSSIERHLYSVDLLAPEKEPTNVTDVSVEGWFSGSFSSGSRFVLVTYSGPGVPYQRLIDLHSGEKVADIESNKALEQTLTKYDIPRSSFSVVNLGRDEAGEDILANAVETRPLNFDSLKKYPVLFYVYGGPGSQLVTKEFAVGFSQVVASELSAVVVMVDGRGTGYNNHNEKAGSNFKFTVRDKLGFYEPRDQILAAKLWAQKPYVDAERIAIWGWSYGGFLTLKTLETDYEDGVFSYGVAVAPVTKWKLYDSIYTERYLRTPQENPSGYESASIFNVTNFERVNRFLIMHGTGDDNVHFQNSLLLIDDFNLEGVENFDFMTFPDSDHSIRYHNGNTVVFDRIESWLQRAFSGEFRNTRK